MKTPFSHALIQQKLDEIGARGELPRMFAVVTWGCTASQWLTKALNSHPEILCLHHPRNILSVLSPTFGTVEDKDLLATTQVLGAGYRLAGIVHGVPPYSVPSLRDAFGDMFRAVAVVRDPLPRLRSQYALFEHYRFDPGLFGDLTYVKKRPGYEKVEGTIGDSFPRLCFAHSVNMLNSVIDESRLTTAVLRHEDLTTKPESLAELVSLLSDGDVDLAPDFGRNAISGKPLNKHSRSDARESFAPWQVDAITALVQPEAWQHYSDLGYAVPDFIQPSQAAASVPPCARG